MGQYKSYRTRTIQIRSREEPTRTLPDERSLRSFLQNFGIVLDLQLFRIIGGTIVNGLPNTAIVVFASPRVATSAIRSSDQNEDGSFWQIKSVLAHTPRIGRLAMKDIAKRMYSGLPLKANGQSSGSNAQQQSAGSRQDCLSLSARRPLARQCKTNNWAKTSNDNHSREYITISDSSRETTPVIETETPERMRARIDQLEAENSARALHDATSEQKSVRLAHRTGSITIGRRSRTKQLRAPKAALLREKLEASVVCCKLEAALAQNSTLLDENDALREQLAAAKEELKQKAMPNDHAASLDNTKARIYGLERRVKRLESKPTANLKLLRLMRRKLSSTRALLGSTQEKYTLTRAKYDHTKEGLAKYKEKLRNERETIRSLKEIIAPEVYESLGATQGTIRSLLSAVDRLP
ncbi:unnamed protein product [Rhizoctonia solani]|uniref:Uncharacterized protein n=1 Tax=Rhizoctonia solani TaxID=456999 RepID=A0A8H3HCR7_9AGAM|nr:unnamed protein product [Rhizoctonia solani]